MGRVSHAYFILSCFVFRFIDYVIYTVHDQSKVECDLQCDPISVPRFKGQRKNWRRFGLRSPYRFRDVAAIVIKVIGQLQNPEARCTSLIFSLSTTTQNTFSTQR